MVARSPAAVASAAPTGSFALGSFSVSATGDRFTGPQRIRATETTGAVEVVEAVGEIEAASYSTQTQRFAWLEGEPGVEVVPHQDHLLVGVEFDDPHDRDVVPLAVDQMVIDPLGPYRGAVDAGSDDVDAILS